MHQIHFQNPTHSAALELHAMTKWKILRPKDALILAENKANIYVI